jgi:hypothetical protein
VRSLMNGMKEKDMWKRVFNETYAKQFWTDIRRWFTLCRPTSTDSTSTIQIGRDLELKRPQTVNRNKVRKSHKKPCWWAHFLIPIFFSGIFEPIHSLSTNIDGFDFNNTVIPI